MESKKVKWWILFGSTKMENIRKLSLKKNNGWNEMLERLYWWDIWVYYICLKLGKIQDETQVMIDGNFKKA
jgi:hypothetical protein